MKTKKAFREFLNRKYATHANQGWGKQSGPKTRAYGDWLYSADKGMFDITYKRWTETGTDEG